MTRFVRGTEGSVIDSFVYSFGCEVKGSEEVEWTRGRHDRQPTEFIALSTRREKKRGGGAVSGGEGGG